MKTGIELIKKEREEQILKHGRTTEKDMVENTEGQLRVAAMFLLDEINLCQQPKNWDGQIWVKMQRKPLKERLVIAGALIAAEIDRLTAIEE